MSLKKWELEADEFFAERTVYILQQTVQKLSGAVHPGLEQIKRDLRIFGIVLVPGVVCIQHHNRHGNTVGMMGGLKN